MKKRFFLIPCIFHCISLYASHPTHTNECLRNESVASTNAEIPLFPYPCQETESVESSYPLLPENDLLTAQNYNHPFNSSTETFLPPFFSLARQSPNPLQAFSYNRKAANSFILSNGTTAETNNNANPLVVPHENQLTEDISIKKNKKKKAYKCPHCPKKLASPKSLKCHKKIHDPNRERSHKCLACDKGFYTKSILQNHIKRLHNPKKEKPHTCNICGKGFFEKYKLKLHGQTHDPHRPRPFECLTCKKRFYVKRALEVHLRKHTGEKKFKCMICSRGLSSKVALANHVSIHLNVKQFKCEKCKKSFRQNIHLQEHIKTHKDKQPYKCNICTKAYTSSNGLRKHFKKIHVNR